MKSAAFCTLPASGVSEFVLSSTCKDVQRSAEALQDATDHEQLATPGLCIAQCLAV